MKRYLSLLTLLAFPAAAAVVVQLDPAGGSISGQAGTTVGWGFTISSNTHFLVVNGIDLLPLPSMGTYTDMISFRPDLFIVGPGPDENPVRSEVFDLLAETGMANFAILPAIPDNTTTLGALYFNYSLFTVSPNDPLFDPGLHFVDAYTAVLPVQITVTAPTGVPEPSSFALGAAALGVLVTLRRRRTASAASA